ncbi:SGNH/GDSL hydrolase family protein [Roseateles sp. BYS87W]|uniref:SGNH/GDSL hydrolase family protein n=1 Tax=Pelomonas baiyunensis TaxID=3299026 RepID=A0ABW7GWD5_9BURK
MITGPVWNEQELSAEGVFPTVLAVGDSWFWYLKSNLLNGLHKILNEGREHIILVRGANGAEAREYVTGLIRAQLERDLNPVTGYGKALKAVFVSGGGNDLAGPKDFVPLLRPDCSAATSATDCFKTNQPGDLFKEVINAHTSTVSLVQSLIPGTPVFLHGYDYANPNGLGFLGFGQWLQVPMDMCKVPRALQQEVVNHCINTYWTQLEELQKSFPGVVRLVDQRGTLKPEDWANELHPTPAGFRRLANRWKPELKAAGLI